MKKFNIIFVILMSFPFAISASEKRPCKVIFLNQSKLPGNLEMHVQKYSRHVSIRLYRTRLDKDGERTRSVYAVLTFRHDFSNGTIFINDFSIGAGAKSQPIAKHFEYRALLLERAMELYPNIVAIKAFAHGHEFNDSFKMLKKETILERGFMYAEYFTPFFRMGFTQIRDIRMSYEGENLIIDFVLSRDQHRPESSLR